MVVAFLKIGVATAVMAGLCFFGNRMLFADLTAMPLMMKAIWLGGLIGVSAGAYFAVALLLKVDEVGEMVALVKAPVRLNARSTASS